MKRICLIIHSLGIGGMERVMAQLIKNFSRREETEIDLILIGNKRKVVYQLPDSISIHRPAFEFDNSRRLFHIIRTIYFLRKKVKEIDPDSILSFGEYWNNLVLLSLFGLRYPVFISDRSEPDKDLGTVHNYLRNVLYPRASGYIAQTEEAKKICLSKEWNDNIKVIGNPIRDIQTNEQEVRENIVLSVGRLITTKHFDQLIKIFAEIGNPNWKLKIVGGDAKKMNLSSDLNTLIRELGIENHVSLEGEQKNIDTYYRKSKLFAFTSSSEGFPNVIGEALSAGLPVIAYNCVAGPSDMIRDGENGFLIPLFNQDLFKKKLSLLMNSEERRKEMAKKAKNSIAKFDSELISEKFYCFLNKE